MTNPGRRRVASHVSIVAFALTAFLSLGLMSQGAPEAQVGSLPLDFSDVVVFATNSVHVAHHAHVVAGHVVVNNASPGPTLNPGVELGIDRNVVTPAGYAIVADSIDVANFAVVNGNAFYNSLSNAGTINGSLNTPLAPFPLFAPLPPFQTASPGTQDVTVLDHQVQTLAPGNYRDIVVQAFATLKFSAGVYNIRSITTDKNVQLLFQNLASGTADVRVLNQVTTGPFGVVGPDDGDPLKAAKIILYVAFPSGSSLAPAAFSVGKNTTLKANVYAPNGTLILNEHVNATGAFLARDVSVDHDAQVDLESFFNQQAPAITSANATTFTVGQAGTFTVTTTGTPTPSITRGGVALPATVTFMDNGDGTGTLSGTPASGTTGVYAITFTATNAAGSSPTQNFTLTVAKRSQMISFTSAAPAGATVGGPTYNVTATATSGLAVSFTIDASASAVCSVAGSTVSFLGVGMCVINANQPGNADFQAAPQVQQSFAVVGKASQTIGFTSVPPATPTVGATYNVSATATSGLAVTFTIDASASLVCSIVGSTVSFGPSAGTCVVNADQPGDASYHPAPQAQQAFGVKKGQTITFTSMPPLTPTVDGLAFHVLVGGPIYHVTAVATSGLPVTITIDASASEVCNIGGPLLVAFGTDAGVCVINASQAGDAEFYPAQAQQSFVTTMPPNSPAGLTQNNTLLFSIAIGGATGETTVVLMGTMNHRAGKPVRLEVEIRPLGTAFSNVAMHSSGFVASNLNIYVFVSVPGLIENTFYHWHARTVDIDGVASNWLSFGGNPEDVADFLCSS